ncbi:hypothetical protein [Flavobacterium sharifuzzamanii]|uniref:hypothetical protein n=1 Tax=Flavobacterium sharifuzzamanii TaxID=2211133 RepID=UPI000DAD1F7E|nr:hypothetical protein [Flavobacterium sharifuzzamanii]KAF2081309.1 hypothetical protein DMA14_09925 [Flavobacterium sharifuzzamanii]
MKNQLNKMTATEIFNIKLAELKSQIIEVQKNKNTSGILLYKDYLSKMYEWYVALGIEEKWLINIYKTKDGHNLFHLLAPEFKNNLIDLEDFRVNYLNDITILNSKYRGFEYIYVYLYIYWQIFKNSPSFEKYQNLPDPYEPVIKILLRGNHVYKGEMSTIEVDNLPIKRQTDFRLPSLDYDFLEYIDEICIRSGSGGIPNQEKTNQLWEDFKKLRKMS